MGERRTRAATASASSASAPVSNASIAPKPSIWRRRALVPGVVGQAGVADPRDPGMVREAPGELGGRACARSRRSVERAQAAQGEPGLDRPGDRAVDVAPLGSAAASSASAVTAAPSSTSACPPRYFVALCTDDVGAVVQRLLHQRRRERVVDRRQRAARARPGDSAGRSATVSIGLVGDSTSSSCAPSRRRHHRVRVGDVDVGRGTRPASARWSSTGRTPQ